MNPWVIIGALLACIGCGVQGYRMGSAANQAVHEAALSEARGAAIVAGAGQALAEAKRLAAEQQTRLLAQSLEDAANADPVQSGTCLPRARVLRLNNR